MEAGGDRSLRRIRSARQHNNRAGEGLAQSGLLSVPEMLRTMSVPGGGNRTRRLSAEVERLHNIATLPHEEGSTTRGGLRATKVDRSLIPLSKYYERNNQLLSAFWVLCESRKYGVAYAVGVQFVETALFEIPRHGYYRSDRHKVERIDSVKNAAFVANALTEIAQYASSGEGDSQASTNDAAALAAAAADAAETEGTTKTKEAARLSAIARETAAEEGATVPVARARGNAMDESSTVSSLGDWIERTVDRGLCGVRFWRSLDRICPHIGQQLNRDPLSDLTNTEHERYHPASPPALLSPAASTPTLAQPADSNAESTDEDPFSNQVIPSHASHTDAGVRHGAFSQKVDFHPSDPYEEVIALQEALYLSGLESAASHDVPRVASPPQGDATLVSDEERREGADASVLPPTDLVLHGQKPVSPHKVVDEAPLPQSPSPSDETPAPIHFDLEAVSQCLYDDFKSLRHSGRIMLHFLDTYQGKYPGSVNGCTVIAPLLAIHHLQNNGHPSDITQTLTDESLLLPNGSSSSSQPPFRKDTQGKDLDGGDQEAPFGDNGVSDDVIREVIDAQAPTILPEVRSKLHLRQDALIIPSDVHDYLMDQSLLTQQQFVAVCGGNILDPDHMGEFVKTLVESARSKPGNIEGMEQARPRHHDDNEGNGLTIAPEKLSSSKLAATLYFHEHVISILRLIRRRKIRRIIKVVKEAKPSGEMKSKRRWKLRRPKVKRADCSSNDTDQEEEVVEEIEEEVLWFDLIDSLPSASTLGRDDDDATDGDADRDDDATAPSANVQGRGTFVSEEIYPLEPPPLDGNEVENAFGQDSESHLSHLDLSPEEREWIREDTQANQTPTSLADADGNVDPAAELIKEGWMASAVRIRCYDVQSLEATLKWYACSKFTDEDQRYVESYPWDEQNSDFDPRVFQAFVWSGV